MTKEEALKLALDFVASISPAFICEATHHKKNEWHTDNEPCPHVAKQKATYEAIKEALAQPEQEPVATLDDLEQEIYENTRQFVSFDVMEWMLKRYYTTPPQRKPLTDEEIILIVAECAASHQHTDIHFARAIERAHGIKELV